MKKVVTFLLALTVVTGIAILPKIQVNACELCESGESNEVHDKDSNRPDVTDKIEIINKSDNLKGIAKYITSVDKGQVATKFFVKKDVIILGYNKNQEIKTDNGFIVPSIRENGNVVDLITDTTIESESDKPGIETEVISREFNINTNLLTLDNVKTYVSEYKDILIIKKKDSDILSSFTSLPEYSIIFDGETGDYVGILNNYSIEDVDLLRDESIFKITSTIETKVGYNSEKTSANLSFDYNLQYPEPLGGITLKNFDIMDSSRQISVFDSISSLKYIGDIQKSKGSIKNIPISVSGDLVLILHTTQGDVEKEFKVDRFSDDALDNVTTDPVVTKPNVTFSDMGTGILQGTPTAVTMYSDIDATLIFNGETSSDACKEYTFVVTENGEYTWSATSSDGGEVTGTFIVDCFVDEATAINYGDYANGGDIYLPQTGGIGITTVIVSGILLILGGILLLKRDTLLTMLGKRKKV